MVQRNILPKLLLALTLFVLTTGFSLKCSQQSVADLPPVTLEYWRVFENKDTLDPGITAFTSAHPNVNVVYKKFRYEEYETQLLNAFAEDRAPDIFSIPNTWVRRNAVRLMAMPPSVTLSTYSIQGTLKKEEVIVTNTTPTPSPREIQEKFVGVVPPDILVNGATLGLPLGLDTLVLFYNKDLLAQAGIAEPPKTWKQVQETTPKLTKLNTKGEITQSAIALGGATNIPRAFDILSLLMFQNGGRMEAGDGTPIFDKPLPNSDATPGPEALQFYTDFANPGKTTYTWNATLPDAFEMFTQGRLAMFLGYSYHYNALRNSTPFNWDVAPTPQVDPSHRSEYANYWVESVSRRTKHPNEAWGLVLALTAPGSVENYLTATNRPTALRSLVEASKQRAHPLNIFSDAVLTAKSWYHGENPATAEDIFRQMIKSVVDGGVETQKATHDAAVQVSNTMLQERP